MSFQETIQLGLPWLQQTELIQYLLNLAIFFKIFLSLELDTACSLNSFIYIPRRPPLIESNENSACKYVFPPAFRARGIPQHFEAKVCDLREPILLARSHFL